MSLAKSFPRAIAFAVALLVAQGGAAAQEAPARPAAEAPLFASAEPLVLTLEADFDRLEDDRDEESEERPGKVLLAGADGQPVTVDVQVRTRGKFRLQRRTCAMPNLRLNFKKGQLDGTPLEGQDKLKLVGYCRDRDDYEQNVLEEYLVYRAYNLVTPISFKVRLARITYRDVNGKKDPVTRWGFLIEDEDALAERLGGIPLDVNIVAPQDLDGEESVRTALFQYMVGNTDFSMVEFHNAVLLRLADGEHVSIPYDFDWSGIVDAPYAAPDPKLGTRTVRQRVYRGFCRPEVALAPQYAFFNERREAFYALFREQEGLEEKSVQRAVEYLDDFYETINDAGRARSRIERACRSMETGR